MTYSTIIYEKKGTIAYVTLNRPDRLNAYDIEMRDDLFEAFGVVRDDPDVRAMIVSGSGNAFCAGADLSEFGTAPSPVIARDVRWERNVWGVLKNLDKLTIAAMHGYALGSGLELALFCDIRIAAEGTKLGLPETALGFIPAAGATQSLPRVVKRGSALSMILLCERIDAREAHRLGLLNSVVGAESLMQEAEMMASKILAGGPLAVPLAKQAINRGLDLTLREGIALERRLWDLAFASRDSSIT